MKISGLINPNTPPLELMNLGISLFKTNRIDEAITYLKTAYLKDQHNPLIMFNLGAAFAQLEKIKNAEHWLKLTLNLEPNHFNANALLGQLYGHALRHHDALPYLLKAHNAQPQNALINRYLGICYARLKNYEKSIKFYQAAVNFDPTDGFTAGNLYLSLAKACQWTDMTKVASRLDFLNHQPSKPSDQPGESAFINLLRSSKPFDNLKSAQKWSSNITLHLKHATHIHKIPTKTKKRINIGYFSYDFKNHVNLHHLLGVLRYHNQTKFAVTCYAYNPPETQTDARRLIEAYGHRFVNFYDTNDEMASKKIMEDHINILIDINGYTTGNRFFICGYKPAPIQVEYVGYPGTTGAKWMDYLIADTKVVPPSDWNAYTEKLAMLPDCYLPVSYSHLRLSTTTRKDHQLPENAFIFCSFNNSHKFDPEMFQVWCHILKAVPHSLLWLSANFLAQANLKKEASKSGIKPHRLLFAPSIHLEQHLSRLGLADCGLDTFRYNGGATTTDALYRGVPVITKTGTHYASRFGTSILAAANLPELITVSNDAYINLAITLASQKHLLLNVRSKLTHQTRNRLFDIAAYTQNLENLYEKMWSRYVQGLPPDHISV